MCACIRLVGISEKIPKNVLHWWMLRYNSILYNEYEANKTFPNNFEVDKPFPNYEANKYQTLPDIYDMNRTFLDNYEMNITFSYIYEVNRTFLDNYGNSPGRATDHKRSKDQAAQLDEVNRTFPDYLTRCGRNTTGYYHQYRSQVNRANAKKFSVFNLWMVNGYVFVNCRVCFELLDFIVCKTSSRHRHKCCQRHLQGSREFLKPWQASPDGIRHFSTVRHRSEELGRKLAEENRKRREQFEAREREREAEVDRSLLRPEDLEVYEAHKAAVARGHFTYDDPYTGYRVMTRLRHYWRGSCCGNACRHCIYEHDNVAQREKAQRVFNSAFWVDAKDRPDLRQKTRTKTLRGGRAEGSSSPPSLHHTTDDEIDDDIDPLLFKH